MDNEIQFLIKIEVTPKQKTTVHIMEGETGKLFINNKVSDASGLLSAIRSAIKNSNNQ